MFEWFHKKQQPLEAALPIIAGEQGKLDKYSPTWVYVSGWAAAELANLRQRNDGMSLGEVETAAIRGKIKILKTILALPDSPGRGILHKGAGEPPQNHPLMTG